MNNETRNKRKRRVKKPTNGGIAWSIYNVLKAEFEGIQLKGKWRDAIGSPELAHSWIIWGQSSSGKTTFNMQLAEHLSQFERVVYNSMEEGLSASIKAAFNRAGLNEKNDMILVQETMADLTKRLEKPKSPNIVFIDSVRYTKMKWADYQKFCARFPDKILIWVSHAKGKEPKGALAEDIRYDAFVKIYVEGYRAFVSSRYTEGGESTIDIWKNGAIEYWGESLN